MKKRIIIASIFIILLFLLYLIVELNPSINDGLFSIIFRNKNAWYSKADVIAHAGGNYYGLDHTNSKEALEDYINRTSNDDIRVVELDFDFTSDNKLVCSHLYRDKGYDHIPSYEEYMHYNEIGYTPLDFYMIKEYMEKYDNLYIMVDTKVEQHTNKTIVDIAEYMVNNLPKKYIKRLIFQLYYPEQKEQMMNIYKFNEDNLVFSLYKKKYSIDEAMFNAYNNDFKVILFSRKYFNDNEIKRLVDKNFVTVVYTINEEEQKEEYLKKGINIIISDSLPEY